MSSELAILLIILTLSSVMAFADKTQPSTNPALQASAMASMNWLQLVDKGQYAASRDRSSSIMKGTIPRDEWDRAMNMTRKPLGNVTSRQVADQRTAKNPHGLPPGDYMVMYYDTAFSRKPKGHELVTLFLEDGEWRVLTYQFD